VAIDGPVTAVIGVAPPPSSARPGRRSVSGGRLADVTVRRLPSGPTPPTPASSGRARVWIGGRVASAFIQGGRDEANGRAIEITRGCRKKSFEKTRSTLAEVHFRAAVHDVLATNRLRATDEMVVFGAHPYKRSSVLAWGFPDSHTREEQRESQRQGCVEFSSRARRELDTLQAGRARPRRAK
jgi:hypothetical protein